MTEARGVPEVELLGVSKRYGKGCAVVEDLNLTVCKGEFVSLIGPSGCGKSTVLKLISGLTLPNAGSIRVDGMTPANARETVSYIFQDATLLPWRTVRQNVGLALELEGVIRHRREEKIAAVKDFETGPYTEKEKQGFRLADRLHEGGRNVSDAAYSELQQHFTEKEVIELFLTAAAFEMFPRFIDGLQIPTTPLPAAKSADG